MAMAMSQAIPWVVFEGDRTHLWVHYSFVLLGFLLAIVSAIAQWKRPAPYGKHNQKSEDGPKWGPDIPQRIGHILSDAVPGVLLFILVFFLYGSVRDAVNIVFLILFELHYIHRGILHPLIMRYSSKKVPIGITIGGLIPNSIYHFANADWIGSARYDSNYYYDPRFLLGCSLYITGFIINRWADLKLRSLRQQNAAESIVEDAATKYSIPHGGFFELISCPNYFGEFVEWVGWALATWSLAGVVWCLFVSASFFPRSRHNHRWYLEQFKEYPKNRKALIPYLY